MGAAALSDRLVARTNARAYRAYARGGRGAAAEGAYAGGRRSALASSLPPAGAGPSNPNHRPQKLAPRDGPHPDHQKDQIARDHGTLKLRHQEMLGVIALAHASTVKIPHICRGQRERSRKRTGVGRLITCAMSAMWAMRRQGCVCQCVCGRHR